MKRNSVLFSLIACIVLAACSTQQAELTFVPSLTPSSSATFTSLPPIQTSTNTPTSTYTPTPTSLPYPTKQVLLEYGYYEGHGLFEDVLSPNIPNLILYSDGQLIITNEHFRERIFSEGEINRLLSQLERKGLYTIETNHTHDPSNRLYNFGNNYQKVFDGGSFCISVYAKKTRTLCAYEPLKDFLIPSMKNLLAFLDAYNPNDMSFYRPDRILLEIQSGSDFLPAELKTPPIDWPNTLPSLGTSSRIYAEGKTAAEIFALFDYSAKWQIFNENGSEYTVFARPILPNETLLQP